MKIFDATILLSGQVLSAHYSGLFDNYCVGFQERLGPDFPPTASDRPNIVLIEDRDKFNILTREPRFRLEGLAEAFEGAEAVLAVLYRRPGQRDRLGREQYTPEHEAAVAATLRSEAAVFVKTTNDRLSYWSKISRHFAPDAIFRYTDSDGAARITAMARSAA